MDFVLRITGKAMGDHGIKLGSKTLLDLDYSDDLGILDESVSKMNELLEVLQVQGARIGTKINVKQTKLLRLGISKDEKVMLGNVKINQVNSFTYLGSRLLLVKMVHAVKMLKIEGPGCFSQLKINLEK
jgi:hypothetical protein